MNIYTISTTSHVKFPKKKGFPDISDLPNSKADWIPGGFIISGIRKVHRVPLQLGNWFKDRGLQPSFAQLAAFTLTAAQLKDGRSFEKWGYTMLYYPVHGGCMGFPEIGI